MEKMIALITTYFSYLLHPIESHRNMSQYGFKKLSFYEALSVSWLISVVNSLVKLGIIGLLFGFILSIPVSDDFNFPGFDIDQNLLSYYFLILSLLYNVFTFPIITLVVYKFWGMIFRMFATFMKIDNNIEEKINNILIISLSSYGINILPFIGDFFQKLLQYFFFFIGLREQLKLTRLEALLVLMFPMLAFTMFLILMTLLVIMALS